MAVRFNAAADKLVRTTDFPTADGASHSVCFWMRREGDGSANFENPWSLAPTTPPGGVPNIEITRSTSQVEAYPYESPGVTIHPEISNDVWYFAWAIFDAAYDVTADCLAIGDAPTAGHTATSAKTFTPATMELGTCSFYSQNFVGSIAAYKHWSAVLTPTEIQQERWLYRPKRLESLHLWSPLIVNSRDYSGNGRDWTEGGTLTWEDGPPIGWGASPLSVGATVSGFTVAQASPIAATASVLVPSTRILYPGSVIPTITL